MERGNRASGGWRGHGRGKTGHRGVGRAKSIC